MRSPLPSRGLAALLLLLAGFWTSSSAHAFCGFYAGKADASLFNRASQVVVVRDGTRSVISMLNDYQGPLNEFALVVPTPTALQQGQVRVAEKAVFEHLDAYSSPRLAEYHDEKPCDFDFDWGRELVMYSSDPLPSPAVMAKRSNTRSEKDRALGVTVEAQYTLEEYDIVSLSATQSDGLETWLRQNGYKLPQGASAALRPYIRQGMKFFVAKVNLKEQARLGFSTLRPLQFAVDTDKFMLPMRLGMLNAAPDEAQDLIVYLLTKEGRVESSNYRTVPLPANMNLPFFVKPRFADFYKALFDREAKAQQHRAVFTEYFWDMAWCDPCAANPLSPKELRQAGVFWLDEARAGAARNGAAPVKLTRLHLRYTPESFPDDLMFTQTKDRNNWQSRYVIQTPYAGSVAACSEEAAAIDCANTCQQRIDSSGMSERAADGTSPISECVAACQASKQAGLSNAKRYYEETLPTRLASERETLSRLTGWSPKDIAAMPGAERFQTHLAPTGEAAPESGPRSWWRKLFAS